MSEPVDVFFYSYYQDEALLRERGAEPSNPRAARLDGWRLHLGGSSNLVPADGQSVWGTVFALTHDELDGLYAHPGVAAYLPYPALVETETHRALPVLCYLPRHPHEDGKPDPAHVARLREVMLARGIPVSGLDEALHHQAASAPRVTHFDSDPAASRQR